jgi:hypothetical protein
MSATTITAVIVMIICVSVGLIYLAQARERARVERIRKINLFSDRYRKMQQLLHELPPQYLNNELRLLVVERSIETLNELLSLKPDSNFQQALEQDTDYARQLRENNPKFQPVAVRDEATAKNVRLLLDILFRFVENLGRRKLLPGTSANKYLEQIRFAACQSRADMFLARAEQAKKNGKLRVAIHNFHNAVDAYKEVASHPQASEAIKQFRHSIRTLEAEADHQKQQQQSQTQTRLETSSEWDSFLKEDDSWKKKKGFED